MHASYKEAIDWIARNDEESEMNPDYIADSLTVQLVADLWRKAPDAVAQAVYVARVRIVATRERNRRNEEIAAKVWQEKCRVQAEMETLAIAATRRDATRADALRGN